MKALSIKNLKKHFNGINAVDDLSIEIEKAKITGIIGPNGSGKTTLVNLLSGMLKIDGGMVYIGESFKLKKIKPYDIPLYGITRTFQDIRLFEQMTVLDNILVVLTEKNIFAALIEKHGDFHIKKAEEVLKRVGIWEKRNELAINLSYGQRKLLEIARALSMNDEIYLFDEPFAGLFPEMIKVVISTMKELKENGKTVILIEHNMKLIRELCDCLIVMDSGRLLAEGEPEKVLAKKEIIEAYLGQ